MLLWLVIGLTLKYPALKNKHVLAIVGVAIFLLLCPRLLHHLIELGLDNVAVRFVVACMDYLIGGILAIGMTMVFCWFIYVLLPRGK